MVDINCPKCSSANWRCVDERNLWFDCGNDDWQQLPVGYLVCQDCGRRYLHHDWDDCKLIGDDREAFGDPDYCDRL